MGVEFSLHKTRRPESYLLGKPAMRPPLDDWAKRIRGINPVRDFAAWQAVMQPSERAMWRIGTDGPNSTPFRSADRWKRETLAELVRTACLQEDHSEEAFRIADDLIRWAGDDELLLVPESIDYAEIADRYGLPHLRHQRTGSRYADN